MHRNIMVLIGLAALAVSCSDTLEPISPPEQPPSPPPEIIDPKSRQKTERPAPQRRIPKPAFVVSMLRWEDGESSKMDGEKTTYLVNLLMQNKFSARRARKLPDELPTGIIEAALASAAAQPSSGKTDEIFIYGEIRPGAEAQVRLVGVDLRTTKQIDNTGNVGPQKVLDEMIRRSMEELLQSVKIYLSEKNKK